MSALCQKRTFKREVARHASRASSPFCHVDLPASSSSGDPR